MQLEEPPTTRSRTCKECGDLYVPSRTNREGTPIDSNGNYTENKCRTCRKGEINE